MSQENQERFFPRIFFRYAPQGDILGREITCIYDRRVFDQLNIKRQQDDNSQLIAVGDILNLALHKSKVVEINFKLEEHFTNMSGGHGIDLLSPGPQDYNCQITVFVERID